MIKSLLLKITKTLKCSKSDGWRTLKRRRTQNLGVEITENIELRKIWCLKLPKTLNGLKLLWLKFTKRMKNAKSDGWNYTTYIELREIWSLKFPKTLKCSKSDGWSFAKTLKGSKSWWLNNPWNAEELPNLMVEITENLALRKTWRLKFP